MEVQLEAVKRNEYAIRHIENPSLEVQMAAIEQSEYAIQFIENPHPEVQLAAVKQNKLTIEYIKNPSPEVMLEILKNIDLKDPEYKLIDNKIHCSVDKAKELLNEFRYLASLVRIAEP